MLFDIFLLTVCICIFIFLVDDLYIDYIAFSACLAPIKMGKQFLDSQDKSKPIAIMIANWKESDVIETMVTGNFSGIDHNECTHVFLGVYPNDHETLAVAARMAKKFSKVHLVVNEKNGPTFKGQMLNQIVEYIFNFEKENGFRFAGFVLHDSEDILSEYQTQVYRYGLTKASFIQVPVFSLVNYNNSLVGGTYIDEFIEMHTKELLVRQFLGAALPSAGVGTCLSRGLILKFYFEQGKQVFLPNSLTEDYNLGLQTKIWGFKSIFLCFRFDDEDKNIIATREIFPQDAKSAIRQKSRWVTGIVFQGYQKFKWFGNFNERYFLWRDRKSIFGSFLTLSSIVTLFYLVCFKTKLPEMTEHLLFINFMGFFLRVFSRCYFVYVYANLKESFLSILRWPFAIYINMSAGMMSCYQQIMSIITNTEIKWVKTAHHIPQLAAFKQNKILLDNTNLKTLCLLKTNNQEKVYEI